MTRRPLFLRVFAWFWVALLAMLLVLVGTLQVFDPELIGIRWTPLVENSWIEPYGIAAAKAFEESGRTGLQRYIEQNAPGQRIFPWLFDAAGVELSGREPAAGVRKLATLSSEGREIQLKASLRRTLVASSVTGPSGARYRIVVEIPREAATVRPLLDSDWIWAVLAGLLTLSAICYAIARGLAGPAIQVSEAARKIASGDLGVRLVDPRLLNRRDEFSELGRDFNAMAGRIEELVNAKQRLLWDISHELRSPLTRLSLALGMARRKSGENAAPALDRIERETEHLNRLIEQLLTLARITGGTGPFLNEQIDLAGVVREVVLDAEFEASGMNRFVHLSAADRGCVAGARELLKSAIENVVRNAVKYTAEGTGVTISVTAREDRNAAVIQVRDQGPGVPDETLPQLFEAFYRVQETRETMSGSGLGLAITNQVVLAHGGWVKAYNAIGGGLTVEIGLPLTSA